MKFTDVEYCCYEVERAKKVLAYIEKKEDNLKPVYETLAVTLGQSKTTCEILRKVQTVVGKAKGVYSLLSDTNFQASPPVKASAPDKNPVVRASKDEHNSIVVEKAKVTKQSSLRPAPRTESCAQQKRKLSTFARPVRNPRKQLPLEPRKVQAPRPISESKPKRIRHNNNYPKPWLDPPAPKVRTATRGANTHMKVIGRRESTMRKPDSGQFKLHSSIHINPIRRTSSIHPVRVNGVPAVAAESRLQRAPVPDRQSLIVRHRDLNRRRSTAYNERTRMLDFSRRNSSGHAVSDGDNLRRQYHRRVSISSTLHRIPER